MRPRYLGHITSPIKSYDRSYTDLLIELLDDPNEYISKAAETALQRHRHPIVLNKLVDNFKNHDHFLVRRVEYPGIYTLLADMDDPRIDKLLWDYYLNKCHENMSIPSVIPSMLAHRTDESILEKALLIVIQSDYQNTPYSIRAFADTIPQFAISTLKNNMPLKSRSKMLWCRFIVARGLCGDHSVKEYLLEILPFVNNIKWVKKYLHVGSGEFKVKVSNEDANIHFQSLLFDAIRNLKLIEACEHLWTLVKSNNTQLQVKALNTLLFLLLERLDERDISDWYINFLIDHPSLTFMDISTTVIWEAFPEEMRKKYLTRLRQSIDKCVETEDAKYAKALYTDLFFLRINSQRRYLDILSGFPFSL